MKNERPARRARAVRCYQGRSACEEGDAEQRAENRVVVDEADVRFTTPGHAATQLRPLDADTDTGTDLGITLSARGHTHHHQRGTNEELRLRPRRREVIQCADAELI